MTNKKYKNRSKTIIKIMKLYDEKGWTYRVIDHKTGEWRTYNER